MEDKKRVIFPKGFFTKDRPIITDKEALKDVIPVKWSEEVKDDKKKNSISFSKKKYCD